MTGLETGYSSNLCPNIEQEPSSAPQEHPRFELRLIFHFVVDIFLGTHITCPSSASHYTKSDYPRSKTISHLGISAEKVVGEIIGVTHS